MIMYHIWLAPVEVCVLSNLVSLHTKGGPLYSVVLLLTPPRRGEERGGSVQDVARDLNRCDVVQ
jgi:hypothetical protein